MDIAGVENLAPGAQPIGLGWILITATIRWLLCVIVQNLAARLQYHFGLNFRSNNLSSPGDSRGRGAQKPITFSDEQYLVACQFVKFSRNPATDFFIKPARCKHRDR